MAGLSNYLETKLIDHVLRGIPYVRPTSVYVSLHTADPTDAGISNELTAASYQRAAVFCAAGAWSNTNGQASNAALITFPDPLEDWGAVSNFGIWDSATGGNLLFVGPLSATRVVYRGDTVSFPVSLLNIVFD